VEDEIRPESGEEVEMKVKQKVAESREEPSAKDKATQIVDNQGEAVGAACGSGLEVGGGADEEDIGCCQVKTNQDRVSSSEVSTCAKVESPVLCCDKVIYSVPPMQDNLKNWGEEFDVMEVEKADVVAGEKPKKLENGSDEAVEGVEGKDGTDASGIESLENSLEVKNTERVEDNLHFSSTAEAEDVDGDALKDFNCTKGKVKSVECSVKGCGKMFHSRYDLEDHMRGTHGAEKLSCPTPGCEVDFVSRWGLKCHIKNHHHKDRAVVSKLKNEKKSLEAQNLAVNRLRKTGSLKQHKKNKECSVEGCLKRFYTEHLKEDHMRMDHGKSKLNCQKCEASYFSRDGLNGHMKKVHTGEDDARKFEPREKRDNATPTATPNATPTGGNVGDMSPIPMKVQETEVDREELSVKDEATHLVDNQEKTVGAARGSDLEAGEAVEVKNCKDMAEVVHLNHDAQEDVVCTDEGKSGSNAGARMKAVKCVFIGCEKMFYSHRDMEDHMRRRHGAEKLSCPRPSCEAEFGSWWGLKRHIKTGHEKQVQQVKKRAVIECKVEGCLKKFLPYNLNQRREDHMRKEHGQSKLICQLCKASYFSKEGLHLHMKRVHKGENDATERELGDKKDNATSSVGKVGDMYPIAVKVQELEVEVLDMEIF